MASLDRSQTHHALVGACTVSFAEQQGKTRLTLHTRFASPERKQAAADARFVVSWEEALQRLAVAIPAE